MWTLKGELEKRGMTVEDACKACGMGMKTMDILVNGGVTMPTLALKVGRGLGLKQSQVKQLGKPLDRRNWPEYEGQRKWTEECGLPVPDKTDLDEQWWRRL